MKSDWRLVEQRVDVVLRGMADVVVERWQGLTGWKATLEGDGRAFDAVAGDRVRIAA